jgi:hypothetical protein
VLSGLDSGVLFDADKDNPKFFPVAGASPKKPGRQSEAGWLTPGNRKWSGFG